MEKTLMTDDTAQHIRKSVLKACREVVQFSSSIRVEAFIKITVDAQYDFNVDVLEYFHTGISSHKNAEGPSDERRDLYLQVPSLHDLFSSDNAAVEICDAAEEAMVIKTAAFVKEEPIDGDTNAQAEETIHKALKQENKLVFPLLSSASVPILSVKNSGAGISACQGQNNESVKQVMTTRRKTKKEETTGIDAGKGVRMPSKRVPRKRKTADTSIGNNEELNSGKQRKPVGRPPGRTVITCNVCEKTYKGRYRLRQHMRSHTGEKPYNCEICGATFSLSGTLKAHMNIHTKEKLFICQFCGKSCADSGTLARHVNMKHTHERKFVCETCGVYFYSNSTLNTHRKYVHAKARPRVCTICNKSFGRAGHLALHMRTHTGEKPYKCTHCERFFSQSSSMYAHMRRIHKAILMIDHNSTCTAEGSKHQGILLSPGVTGKQIQHPS